MNQKFQLTVRYRSSPNIAWVKYWGKFDEQYILPINDSLGVTLDSVDINTETTIVFAKAQKDYLILNKEEHPITKRILKMFGKIKKLAYQRKYKNQISEEEWQKYKFKIQSQNSFPTASGMASSASGLACLAAALNGLFDNILSNIQLSELARLGSGSASRSIYGGLVRWKGVSKQVYQSNQKSSQLLQKLSTQCVSATIVPHEKLNYFKVMILLANDKKKEVSSTSGMIHSVQTSQLIHYRNQIASKRIQLILSCLNKVQNGSEQQKVKSFNSVIQNIIKDSNQFHAICLDTYPPIFYLNEFSKQIIYIVDNILNPCQNLKYKVAYTFDAGPHAFLFIHQSVQSTVLQYFHKLFELPLSSYNTKAQSKIKQMAQKEQEDYKFKSYQGQVIHPYQIWSTSVGGGAHQLQ